MLGSGSRKGLEHLDVLPSYLLPSLPASPHLPVGPVRKWPLGGWQVPCDSNREKSPNPVRSHSLPSEGTSPGVLPPGATRSSRRVDAPPATLLPPPRGLSRALWVDGDPRVERGACRQEAVRSGGIPSRVP